MLNKILSSEFYMCTDNDVLRLVKYIEIFFCKLYLNHLNNPNNTKKCAKYDQHILISIMLFLLLK